MKKALSVLLIGSMVSMSIPAWADPPVSIPSPPALVPGEPDVGAAISPMRKGQVAPFTGVLLSPTASATVTVNLNNIQNQIQIAVDKAKSESTAWCDKSLGDKEAGCTADKKVAQAQLDEKTKENAVLADRLAKEEKNHANLPWWTAGGVVTGIAVTLLSALVYSKATK